MMPWEKYFKSNLKHNPYTDTKRSGFLYESLTRQQALGRMSHLDIECPLWEAHVFNRWFPGRCYGDIMEPLENEV